jgi:hypothetical protein
MAAIATPQPWTARQVLLFIRHFLEMCVSMCLPGALLVPLAVVTIPRLLGLDDLRNVAPAGAVLVITLVWNATMVAWMRWRGMPWRPTLEMAGAGLGTALALAVLGTVGVIAPGAMAWLAHGGLCMPVCTAMVGAMLARVDVYTGRAGHAHHVHAA